jgi:hypothetical protein
MRTTMPAAENAQLRVENEQLKEGLRAILRDVDRTQLVGLLDGQRLLRAHCHARDAIAAPGTHAMRVADAGVHDGEGTPGRRSG